MNIETVILINQWIINLDFTSQENPIKFIDRKCVYLQIEIKNISWQGLMTGIKAMVVPFLAFPYEF